jgi:hypothetical protein
MKSKRGGKREGSGRKKAPYTTQPIAFRVRTEWVEEIKKIVKDAMIKKKQNETDNQIYETDTSRMAI